jgi:ribosomal-protein-alanine N-acetyltransferase
MTAFLETDRILLRSLERGDVPTWYEWFNDPGVTQFLNKGLFPNTPAAQVDFLDAISRSRADLQLAIVSKAEDELVGVIGLHNIDWVHRHGDMSIVVGNPKYWSKGLASEAIAAVGGHAFTKLNFHKVTAGVWEPNTACRRAFEKCGFVVEGTIREQFFWRDRHVNEIRLGLTRTEWVAMGKVQSS